MQSVRFSKSRARRERRKKAKQTFDTRTNVDNGHCCKRQTAKNSVQVLPFDTQPHFERNFNNKSSANKPNETWVKTGKTAKRSNGIKDIETARDLLVSGYCSNIDNKDIIQTIGLYTRPLSLASERAISSANFFADIIENYQSNPQHKCPFIKDQTDEINLLQYVYIRGGACRDTMLSRDIADIDFIIDTNALNVAYYNHLVKYHATHKEQDINCNCFMWQRYLNMYMLNGNVTRFTDIDHETNVIKKLEKNIVRSDFLLNARFFKDIIIKSQYKHVSLKNIIHAINTWGYTNWVLNVDHSLMYKGIDLKGARFDLGDEMSNSDGTKYNFNKYIVDQNQMVFKAKWNECFDYLWQLKRCCVAGGGNNKFKAIHRNFEIVRDKSIYVCYPEKKQNDDARKNKPALINILMPLYSFGTKYSHQICDFSLNGMRLPLTEIYDGDRSKNGGDYIDCNWYSKILNYSYSKSNDELETEWKKYNKMAIEDIKAKVIKQPDLHILTVEYMYDDYFWRFVKILTKFVEHIHNKIWKVDEETMDQIRASFKHHFKTLNDEKMREFVNRLLFWNINDDNFEVTVRNRLRVFKMMNIDKDLKNAFKVYQRFRLIFRSAVLQRLNAEKQFFLIKALNNFGYKRNMLSINVALSNNKKRKGNDVFNDASTTYSTRTFS